MRTSLICFLLVLAGLGALSFRSGFEIAPPGYAPPFRQAVLLTPAGFLYNYLIDPADIWLRVYDMPARRLDAPDWPNRVIYLISACVAIAGLAHIRRRGND